MGARPRGEGEGVKVGSLFSGCGGMDGGLEAAGMSCAWQVEIDRACLSILRRNWPDVPKHEDITEIQEGDLAPVDLIAGGSPCQDLSVAGRGEGLAGERSGLFHQFVRVADSQPAAWILWENVPGALSSNDGADFGIVLRELSGFWPAMPAGGWRGSGFCVGPKRALAWRVLDSQYFGVAQQRERIFLVGGPRDRGSPAQVLFEPESLPGHPPAGGEARARVAGLLAGSAGGRGWRVGADEAAGGQLVAHTLRGEGHDASEDGAGRGTPLVTAYQCHGSNVGPMGALRSHGSVAGCPFVASALTSSDGGPDDNAAQAGHLVAAPLTSRPYADHAAQEGRLIAFGGNRPGGERDTAAAANARGGNRLDFESETLAAYRKAQKAHHAEDCERWEESKTAPALDAGGHSARTATAIVYDMQNDALRERCGAIQAAGQSSGNRGFGMITGRGVRRLTPRECERLQGFPDDWTRWADDGRELKDSPRYRMIGNAVTWPVAEWIGRRILEQGWTGHTVNPLRRRGNSSSSGKRTEGAAQGPRKPGFQD